jgi:hypothetical protein
MSLPVAVSRPQVQAGLLNALADTPVVCLAGASRTGKSTLLRELQASLPGAVCRSFADPATLAEATRDPATFLEGLPALALLDDVDLVPALVPLLKAALASGRRFLLTTTRVLPGLAESLSWSLESFTLWPLAQAECEGVYPGLIDACFQGEPTRLHLEPLTRQDLLERLLAGGYPEVTGLTPSQRDSWFHGYLAAMVRGRLRDLTELREVQHLVRLLTCPDADSGPAKRCRDLLEDCHLLAALASGPKTRSRWFLDAALQAHLLGMAPAALATQPGLAAPLLETFAVMELVKTAPWSGSRPSLSHVRSGAQNLVVLEDHRRQLVAFTVCAAATVQAEAFRALQALRDRVGERLRAGIVLHAGEATQAAGPGLWSMPFQALWAPRG